MIPRILCPSPTDAGRPPSRPDPRQTFLSPSQRRERPARTRHSPSASSCRSAITLNSFSSPDRLPPPPDSATRSPPPPMHEHCHSIANLCGRAFVTLVDMVCLPAARHWPPAAACLTPAAIALVSVKPRASFPPHPLVHTMISSCSFSHSSRDSQEASGTMDDADVRMCTRTTAGSLTFAAFCFLLLRANGSMSCRCSGHWEKGAELLNGRKGCAARSEEA